MFFKINRKLERGLSEAITIMILLGLAITFSLAFLTYMQTDYNSRQNTVIIQKIIESEKMNTIVRFIDTSSEASIILFRKLSNNNVLYFFVFNGSRYAYCRDVVKSIVGGKIIGVYNHSIEVLIIRLQNNLHSFRYYAKSQGYPDTGSVSICAIELEGNTIVALSTPSNNVNEFHIFIVTYINNIPYVVDVYSYRYR